METATTSTNRVKEFTARKATDHTREINISQPERWISGAAGGLLVLMGLKQKSLGGLLLAGLGGTLLYTGATGHCSLYAKLGINTAHPTHPANRSIHIEKCIVVNKPLHEIYSFWRNLENLPRVLPHLISVKPVTDKLSYWTAQPSGTRAMNWAAEIINDIPDRVIAWQSLPDSEVYTAGSVSFRKMPKDQGTEVRICMNYLPPLGKVGHMIATALGHSPELQIEEDLRQFKLMIESETEHT